MKLFNLFLLSVCIAYCSSNAQIATETDEIFNPAKITLQMPSAKFATSLEPTFHHENQKQSLGIKGIVSGILLIAAGTVLSVNGYYCGESHYKRYKKSAFTENTDRIRRKIVYSNLKCVGGGVIAGTGLLVTIFSF
ncbi:MAG: hypothetical protein GX267_14700 [Fibrobacter sp.]|jgi:hypothetical protein|nr:hypothetical protein [Fibrobacter sp.]